MRREKFRLAAEQMDIRADVHLLLISAAKLIHHRIFARDNRGQIDADAARVHSPARSIARVMRHLRRRDHRFRRRAAGVDASAAQFRFFNQRNFPAVIRKPET